MISPLSWQVSERYIRKQVSILSSMLMLEATRRISAVMVKGPGQNISSGVMPVCTAVDISGSEPVTESWMDQGPLMHVGNEGWPMLPDPSDKLL